MDRCADNQLQAENTQALNAECGASLWGVGEATHACPGTLRGCRCLCRVCGVSPVISDSVQCSLSQPVIRSSHLGTDRLF